jgi:hypothetical protein
MDTLRVGVLLRENQPKTGESIESRLDIPRRLGLEPELVESILDFPNSPDFPLRAMRRSAILMDLGALLPAVGEAGEKMPAFNSSRTSAEA